MRIMNTNTGQLKHSMETNTGHLKDSTLKLGGKGGESVDLRSRASARAPRHQFRSPYSHPLTYLLVDFAFPFTSLFVGFA